MKRQIIFIFLILVLLCLCSCTSKKASDLKFYVIPKSSINEGMTDSEIISAVKNNGRVAFDGQDIIGYNWASHTVTLSESAVPTIGNANSQTGGSALFKVDDSYAFVLMLGNKLIYKGGFISGTKNPDVPMQPYIKDTSRYSFSISYDSKYADHDARYNNKLYDFLEYQGLISTK